MTDIPPCQPFSHDTSAISRADTLTPAERYQELFVAVQMQRVFPDSKTFVDCAPRRHPEAILEEYRARCGEPGFDTEAFVHEHFSLYEMPVKAFVANPDDSLAEHIDRLWPILTRHPQDHPEHSSLLPLPHDYVVPGGRFTELYYWDSYFTMLGTDESGHCDLLRAMADNFAYLIDTYGHVPNGNRTYYLGRSRPPVFALMTELFEETGVHRASDYLPQLHKEYAFWMEGADVLRPGEAHRRCVCLADGMVLNRYWTSAQRRASPTARMWKPRAPAVGRGTGLSRLARRCRVGLGFQLALARRRPPAGDHPHHQHPAGRPQRAALQAGAADRRAVCGEEPARLCRSLRPPGRGAPWRPSISTCGIPALAPISTTTGSAAGGATISLPRRWLRCSCAWPAPEARPRRWRRRCRSACWPRRPGHHRDRWQRRQWDRPNGWAPLRWIGIRGLQHYGHDALALDIEGAG